MECPRDRQPLEALSLDHAVCFACPQCGGRAATVELLRRMAPRERLRELWALVRAGAAADAECPSCRKPMRLVALREAERVLQLDGCAGCHVIWFDAGELRALAPGAAGPAPVVDAPVPPDASEQWVWFRFFERLNERSFGGPEFLL